MLRLRLLGFCILSVTLSHFILWSCVPFIIRKSPKNGHWPSWPRKGWHDWISLYKRYRHLLKCAVTCSRLLCALQLGKSRRNIPEKEEMGGNSLLSTCLSLRRCVPSLTLTYPAQPVPTLSLQPLLSLLALYQPWAERAAYLYVIYGDCLKPVQI